MVCQKVSDNIGGFYIVDPADPSQPICHCRNETRANEVIQAFGRDNEVGLLSVKLSELKSIVASGTVSLQGVLTQLAVAIAPAPPTP